MTETNKVPFFLICLLSFVEGFSTLAVEITALRVASPIVGSSVILTSVFLGVILLALSVGYATGGYISSNVSHKNIRYILGGSLIFSGVRYVCIAFAFEKALLQRALVEVGSYIGTLFFVAFGLFFVPVVIASQAIPLLTELTPIESKGKSAGIILFLSTVGSFFGSVLTSIFLFSMLGVQLTGVLVGVLLIFVTALYLMFVHRGASLFSFILGIFILLLGLGVFPVFEEYIPKASLSIDTQYQTVEIREGKRNGIPARFFIADGANASAIYLEGERVSPFAYIRESMNLAEEMQPRSTLVIGTAGFVFPYELSQKKRSKSIAAVDIDPMVKKIAEEHFLDESLPEKISFIPYSGRFVVNEFIKQGKTFDLIFLDAYNGKSLPEELLTVEFFQDIKTLLGKDGQLIANIIMDSSTESVLSQKVFATLTRVFDSPYMKNVTENVGYYLDNFIVTSFFIDGYTKISPNGRDPYTDNKRTTEKDAAVMMYVH